MTGPSARVLTLLSLLQVRREWQGESLADRLGVSTRTIRRDVERLRELGYRIDAAKGPAGGYRLEAGSELPPLLFDDEQAVAIAIALQGAASGGVDIGEAAERALSTVRQVMPSRLRHRIDGIRFARASAADRVDPAVVETVSRAVRDRRMLRFEYGDRSSPPRRTEPHGVVSRGAHWYVVAWECDRSAWRIYRLDRMASPVQVGARFTPRTVPTGSAAAFVEARVRGSERDGAWPCVGQIDVALPAPEVAPWVEEGHVQALDEHSCRLTIGSWSWAGIVALVMRFDAPFRIVGPAALVAASRDLASRLESATAP